MAIPATHVLNMDSEAWRKTELIISQTRNVKGGKHVKRILIAVDSEGVRNGFNMSPALFILYIP
jgi:hypothetical protein